MGAFSLAWVAQGTGRRQSLRGVSHASRSYTWGFSCGSKKSKRASSTFKHLIRCNMVKLCEHGKQRSRCIPCGGVGICQHLKDKTRCRVCGGGSYCQHGERKHRCVHCNGGSICDHGKLKDRCAECNNFACAVEGCPKHGHKYSSVDSLKYHMRTAHADQNGN